VPYGLSIAGQSPIDLISVSGALNGGEQRFSGANVEEAGRPRVPLIDMKSQL